MVVCLNTKPGENPQQEPASAFEANEADIIDGWLIRQTAVPTCFAKTLPMELPGPLEQSFRINRVA